MGRTVPTYRLHTDYISHGKSKARGGAGYQKAWRVENLPETGPAET